jgi:transposase
LIHRHEAYFHRVAKVFVPFRLDLTDEQWAAIRGVIPGPEKLCTMETVRDPRDVLNALLWILSTGAPWADLPRRYPP